MKWLDRYERPAWRGAAHWDHLCGEMNREQIELLLDWGEIRMAEYPVELLPREMLEAKLHKAIRLARGQAETRGKRSIKEWSYLCWTELARKE
jgi:hypothetical protein